MKKLSFVHSYLKEIKNEQHFLLEFLEDEKKDFQDMIDFFDLMKIQSEKYKLKEILHIISQISNNHHRSIDFFYKIQMILNYLQESIKKFFSNYDIFNIFHNNKRVLLILFDEKIIFPDKTLKSVITNGKYLKMHYPEYFFPEFEKLYETQFIEQLDSKIVEMARTNIEIFFEKRKIGENDEYLCELIRNDSINEFITFINKSNISSSTIITPSIFETNLFLIKKDNLKVIEYSSFFGSIQIIKYFLMNKAIISPTLFSFTIHSLNPELFHLIEENNNNQPSINDYFESIKCHHLNLMNYIKNSINDKFNLDEKYSYFFTCAKSYNFYDMDDEIIDDIFKVISNYYEGQYSYKGNLEFFIIFIFSQYDYYNIVKYLLEVHQANISYVFPYEKKELNVLHITSKKGHKELIELFLSKNIIDINQLSREKVIIDNKFPGIDNKSALHYACEKGNPEIVQILLSQKNIEVNRFEMRNYFVIQCREFVYNRKRSPLVIAVYKGNCEIVKLLLSKKEIDVNYMFNSTIKRENDTLAKYESKGILSIAIEKGFIDIIHLLLARKDIDLNIENVYQQYSTYSYPYKMIKEEKKSIKDISNEKGNQQIINLLSLY